MNGIANKLRKAVAAVALTTVKGNANSTCIYIQHQPKLPKSSEKFCKNK